MTDKDQTVPALPSASVILVRDYADQLEVLLVQRNAKIKFHGGAWVFPGGKVDEIDRLKSTSSDDLAVARVAAIRETEEEVGLSVAEHHLTEFSHWLTPVQQPKRFSTWFFITTVDAEVNIAIDDSEIVDHIWLTPSEALRRQAAGDMTLPPPTFVTLSKLTALSATQQVSGLLADLGFEKFAPRIVENDAGRVALYHGDAGFDEIRLDVPGSRHRLHMLKSGWHYENDRAST